MQISNGNDSGGLHLGKANYPLNSYHMITLRYISNSTKYFYFDGVVAASGNNVNLNGANLDTTSDFYIGGYIGNSFNGDIDEFRLYNRALSAGEIQYLYTKTQARYK
jgi:hypothetical protein